MNSHSILAMITTAARSAWPSDISISDGEAAGLAHPSIIRWKVFTLPNQLVVKRVGRLAARDLAAVAETARTALLR